MSIAAGRCCPLAYRYGAAALAAASATPAETLYVVGGLYGNALALDAVEAMAAQEKSAVSICFNGDFNWFNVDEPGFQRVNRRVLAHQALAGNVEHELCSAVADAGCGCAYPDGVEQALVERSNRIHAQLKATAQKFPWLVARLAALPLYARFRVGDQNIGVVHGDADSLAGWRFDVAELDKPAHRARTVAAFAEAQVAVFASSHTCLPVVRRFELGQGTGVVVNNGAAGMPNFAGKLAGLLTRISVHRSAHASVYALKQGGVYIDATPIGYDVARWQADFQKNWPAGSDAQLSYGDRIANGPKYSVGQAYPAEPRA